MLSRALIIVVSLCATSFHVEACDSDADCGGGGTCIKREKRASGVCYGGDFDAPKDRAPSAASGSSDRPKVVPRVTGQRRENAKAWLGDPETMLKEQFPGKAIGEVCIVTQDCPPGSECVLAGFEGRCIQQ